MKKSSFTQVEDGVISYMPTDYHERRSQARKNWFIAGLAIAGLAATIYYAKHQEKNYNQDTNKNYSIRHINPMDNYSSVALDLQEHYPNTWGKIDVNQITRTLINEKRKIKGSTSLDDNIVIIPELSK